MFMNKQMPMKKSNRRRRAPLRKSKRTYKKRSATSSLTKENYAKCSEVISYTPSAIQTDTTENYNWQLNRFVRAPLIAAQYQEFKIDYIEARIKPFYDTYSNGSPAPGLLSKAPQLYSMVLKTGETAGGLDWFKASGINPKSLAKDGNITIRLKPAIRIGNVSTSAGSVGTGFNTIRVSPWMSTNDTTAAGFLPSTVVHYGLGLYIDSQESATTPINVAQIEFEAHFLFRKPNLGSASSNALTKVNGEFLEQH